MRHMPPTNTALRIGVHVGAGTDARRVASYNPCVALRWMLDGKTVGGTPLRGALRLPQPPALPRPIGSLALLRARIKLPILRHRFRDDPARH
jgi:hypothetical protein